MLAENSLSVSDLVWPVFVHEGKNKATPINSLPGVKRFTIDLLVREVKKAASLGIPAIALFPVIDKKLKNENGKEALDPDNLVCRTVHEIKKHVPEIGVICDVALDPYTSHGQDGILKNDYVVNDETVEILSKQAVTLAKAGCDIVAPSDMMDGRIGRIRDALDKAGYENVAILSYAAKYASSFYGPFRDAVGSAANLGSGKKVTYQMNPANSDEAMREVALDIEEGADMVMVKPGMPYLDVIKRVKDGFNIPVFAYQVSGEYAMMKAASENGWLSFDEVMLESLVSMKRAGASAIFTYAAMEVAEILNKKS